MEEFTLPNLLELHKSVAFITGSQAYGDEYRTPDADIDLALLLPEEVLAILWAEAKRTFQDKLMFGRVNLVAFNSDSIEEVSRFEKWREVTNFLIKNPPKGKEEAIENFRRVNIDRAYNNKI